MLKSGNRGPPGGSSARIVTTDVSNPDLERGQSMDDIEVNDIEESERKRSSFRQKRERRGQGRQKV